MNYLLTILIYPLIKILCHFSKYKAEYLDDIQHWCIYRNVNYTLYNGCHFFIEDKSFRNLTYYRLRAARILLSFLFPAYDHLQITTRRGNIEGGLIFQHGFSTIVAAEKIGHNCKIYQQVTIGSNHLLQAPTIGNNVEICCGAKIIGGVHIGDNVLVGANAVVVNDIPSNSIVGGIPAHFIKKRSELRIPAEK